MAESKKYHLHIRWSEEDEGRIQYIMAHYGVKKSDAVRLCVNRMAEHIKSFQPRPKDDSAE